MGDDKFRQCVMKVVKVDRGVRVCGGKMRPYEKPIWICDLDCGHTVERLKSQSPGAGPPARAQCTQCLELLAVKR